MILLTHTMTNDNLFESIQKQLTNEIGVSFLVSRGRLLRFFCTHQMHDRILCEHKCLWWAVLSNPLKGWPLPGRYANLLQSASNNWRYCRRFTSYPGVTVMSQNNFAQNPQIKNVSLFNEFLYRQLIAQGVSDSLALKIKSRYPATVVKFAGFVGGVA